MKTADVKVLIEDTAEDRHHLVTLLYAAHDRLLSAGDHDGAKAIEDGLKALPSVAKGVRT